MTVLVAYATKYGSTQGIAERIAQTLEAEGLKVELHPVSAVEDVSQYDAFVIGSAAFMGSWLKEADQFVHRNRDILDSRPVWLFSSGPTGAETKDKQGRDVLVTSEPKEFKEFAKAIRPRGMKVFFGALYGSKLRGVHRLFALAPAVEKEKIEGDFRDWPAIEEWSKEIARELAPAPVVWR